MDYTHSRTFEKNPDIAAIQPKIRAFKNSKYFEFAGAAGGMIDHLGYPYCRGRVFETIEEDLGQYDDETEIFGQLVVHYSSEERFLEDERFLTKDFCPSRRNRLMLASQKCWKKNLLLGKSTVFHVGGGTLNKQSPQKRFLILETI